ncbi:unnamed protein product [Rotaria sp. Silwood1]|nr:unnamed protein product [Rotaria sp. Silwood1]CAF4948989.1 unnamed protein product [Rotaria sp. Silwood1]
MITIVNAWQLAGDPERNEALTNRRLALRELVYSSVQKRIFHSCATGYDFGYLLTMLTGKLLPDTESEFFELCYKNLKGGSEEIERIGPQHQVGSDSLMIGLAFFKMKELFFEDSIDE